MIDFKFSFFPQLLYHFYSFSAFTHSVSRLSLKNNQCYIYALFTPILRCVFLVYMALWSADNVTCQFDIFLCVFLSLVSEWNELFINSGENTQIQSSPSGRLLSRLWSFKLKHIVNWVCFPLNDYQRNCPLWISLFLYNQHEIYND